MSMEKYKIKISYQTGNSFNSCDEVDFIDYEWTNLDRAKESLLNIKSHNDFYDDNSNVWEKPKGKLPKGVKWDNEFRMIMLELVSDNGESFLFSSFWTGYFERLYSAEIVLSEKDNNLKIEFY